MKYADLLAKVSDLPVFTVSFLAAGQNLPQIRLQISRWVKTGKIIRLHKGLYTLAEPYRKVPCEPSTIANRLKQPSYVSLHSALSWYGMIPEFVPVVTSITTARPPNDLPTSSPLAKPTINKATGQCSRTKPEFSMNKEKGLQSLTATVIGMVIAEIPAAIPMEIEPKRTDIRSERQMP